MASNQYVNPWTTADDLVVIEEYQNGRKFADIAQDIGKSTTTLKKHINLLIAEGRMKKRKYSNEQCSGDCDHCIYADCQASDRRALQVQKMQDSMRYERLPAVDQRVIRWQMEHNLRERPIGKRKNCFS